MTRIAHYRILEKIGEGAMGAVFVAEDTRLERRVALKVLLSENPDASRLKRFEREAKAIAALNHPNILSIYDFGREGEHPYIAMELLDGRTLRVVLDDGKIPLRKALSYGLEIVEGLAAAHDKAISHRDLKPANIFITRDDRVKILDFGLASVRQPLLPDSPAAETMLSRDSPTTPGMVLGTIGYMSPEQVRGQATDHRGDIFAFGGVLFEMLSGERAFLEATAVETMHAILVAEPPFENLERAGLPGSVVQILRRCLEKRAGLRFQSARDLAFAIQTLLAQPNLGSFGSGGPQRDSHSGTGSSASVMAGYRAIAVLPFSNMSSDPDMEYFSDGVTEEIINALAQLPDLRVAARTSSFAFKGKAVNLSEVGARLKVDSVLEGSVRRSGKRLRVTAQLINVSDGYQLWAERYDRDLDDVFAIQDDIATNIASRLQLTLAGGTGEPLVKPSTGYMEAYDLYLQGRYFVEQRGAGLIKGLGSFQQALARDPRFALAHAAIAEVMTLLAVYNIGDPAERMQTAEQAAKTAVELDSNLAEAHNAMAVVKILWEWDWPGSRAEFDRALEINPSHVSARYWKGLFYHQWVRGEHDLALRETRRAVELDPMGTVPLYAEGLVLMGMGRHDEAARRMTQGLERDPSSFLLMRVLGIALLAQGQPEAALAQVEKATALSQRQPFMLGELATTYAATGHMDRAEQIHQELVARSKTSYVSPMSLATVACARGQLEEGLAYLQAAFERRDPQFLGVSVWPSMRPLRQDARVRELFHRIGIGWVTG